MSHHQNQYNTNTWRKIVLPNNRKAKKKKSEIKPVGEREKVEFKCLSWKKNWKKNP